MAGFQIKVNADAFSRFSGRMNTRAADVQKAMREVAKDAADEIEARGADDIEDAGNFGSRWTEGLHADVVPTRDGVSITVSHDVPYFSVFEYGKTIVAKNAGNPPLLWIPFSTNTSGVWPSAFGSPLRRIVSKKGLPILAGAGGPQYFGKEQVTIPQKFHIRDIVKQVAREVKQMFADHMKG